MPVREVESKHMLTFSGGDRVMGNRTGGAARLPGVVREGLSDIVAFEPEGSTQPREGGEGGSRRCVLGLGEPCGGAVSPEQSKSEEEGK